MSKCECEICSCSDDAIMVYFYNGAKFCDDCYFGLHNSKSVVGEKE